LLYADPGEPEYKLLNKREFDKVEICEGSLKWRNIIINVLGQDLFFELDADTLYDCGELEK